jgi:hypothetical protein
VPGRRVGSEGRIKKGWGKAETLKTETLKWGKATQRKK